MLKKRTIIIGIVFVIVMLIIIIYEHITIKQLKTKCESNNSKTNKIIKEKKITSDIRKMENIVFLGDSITEYYPVDSIYIQLPIVKSGVAGYTTQDILDRMDSMVYQYNPTSVFLLIGTNDIMYDGEENEEETISNIKKIIQNIKKNRKKSQIYLESIYPVNRELNKVVVRDRDNKVIKEINEKLETYCQKENIVYIDMYNELINDEGKFDKQYTNDGLHPNDLGYAKISQVRLTYIHDMKI